MKQSVYIAIVHTNFADGAKDARSSALFVDLVVEIKLFAEMKDFFFAIQSVLNANKTANNKTISFKSDSHLSNEFALYPSIKAL